MHGQIGLNSGSTLLVQIHLIAIEMRTSNIFLLRRLVLEFSRRDIYKVFNDNEMKSWMGHKDNRIGEFLLSLEIGRRGRIGKFRLVRRRKKVPTTIEYHSRVL